MSNWNFHNPVRIHFGHGTINDLPALIGLSRNLLITTPGSTKRGTTDLIKDLLGNSLTTVFDEVESNPTFTSIEAALKKVRRYDFDNIIALGGGSALDTAKAVAAIEASGNEDWFSYQSNRKIAYHDNYSPKPIIAIATTAGTGSEVTKWGTIWDMNAKVKHSIEHPLLYPEHAILDPDLTTTLPKYETTYCAFDAVSHAMEAIWNKNYNPISDIYAVKAISIIHEYLPQLINNLTNKTLRRHILQASLLAGLAFSNTKTGLAHSISYPITAHFGLPHGLACSLPLIPILKFNAIKSSDRINIMAKAIKADTTISSMEAELTKLFEKSGISLNLADYGIDESQAGVICDQAYTPERADNNISSINQDDIENIVHSLFN